MLSIQSNRITKLENLDALENLEELYISHNGLTRIEGLDSNLKLATLDIAGNRIREVENVKHLSKMEEFWVSESLVVLTRQKLNYVRPGQQANDNDIQDINQIDEQLGPDHMPSLSTVYLEGNPAYRKEGPAYRRKLTMALPQIQQIDAT